MCSTAARVRVRPFQPHLRADEPPRPVRRRAARQGRGHLDRGGAGNGAMMARTRYPRRRDPRTEANLPVRSCVLGHDPCELSLVFLIGTIDASLKSPLHGMIVHPVIQPVQETLIPGANTRVRIV